MTGEFILEIGTEEIPSNYLYRALSDLKHIAEERIAVNRISVDGSMETYGTPRRLVLVIDGLAERQEDLEQEYKGPPRNVAFDQEGNPTKAAIGFAKKCGVSVDALGLTKTPKGEYLYVKKLIPGRNTIDVLSEILPGIISDIPWPKSMRWGNIDFFFARPIHWILCMLDKTVVPFELAGVKSSDTTRGHRFMAPAPQKIKDLDEYFQVMEKAFVVVDQRKRREKVLISVKEAAKEVGGRVLEDQELVDTVTNLAEYPLAVCGSFDPEFLSLPDPVLITAMREHQKYFAVYDEGQRLMNKFVAVNNTRARDEQVVIKGHERVLRARLSDAAFFFQEDMARPLIDRLEDLKDVIYQADLGTSFAKVLRFKRLGETICKDLGMEDRLEDMRLAADLCKCDLVTHMVTEFPSLQGVMGCEYARLEGYKEDICDAIREHYMPLTSASELPQNPIGAVLSIADRLDTIVGCFAVGLSPSGNSDPFALRRHALAIMRIIEEKNYALSLKKLVNEAIEILSGEISFDGKDLSNRVMEFFRERFRHLMLREGHSADMVEAVISVAFDFLNDLRTRIDHIEAFASKEERFNELALTFKRVSNILKNQEEMGDVDISLLKEECEQTLWNAFNDTREDVQHSLEKKDFYGAMAYMAQLKAPVDNFFDGVEVLTKKDPELMKNRVALLQKIEGLLKQVADFSKFSM